jgi:hypothetical protein
MAITTVHINSLENFLQNLRKFTTEFGDDAQLWFRGEPKVDTPLLPKVFRTKEDGSHHEENKLLQMFRMKAPSFGPDVAPSRQATDQWLFLAQHVGLPTRLLDWTESALLGLYFALKTENPVVWMIDPYKLNEQSVSHKSSKAEINQVLPLTWFDPRGTVKNIGVENIKGAWEQNYDGLELPVAVHPTYIHPRMSAQRSVFTVHGARPESIPNIVPHDLLRRFEIIPQFIPQLLEDLHILGIHDSTAFPDLDGLADELESLY